MEQSQNNLQNSQGNQNNQLPEGVAESSQTNGKSTFDKIKNLTGQAVLFTAAAIGGDLVMAPDAVAQTQAIEQQETWEASFQRMLFKNESILNQELAKMGVASVRLGQPAGPKMKCGGVSFGVYTSSGEHVSDFKCSYIEFENPHMFMDFARKNIIPRLAQTVAPPKPSFSQTAPAAQPYVYSQEQIRVITPATLLGAAAFTRPAADYLNGNELTITAIRSKGDLIACVVRRKESQLPPIEAGDFCYDSKTKNARFDYDSIKNILTVSTTDFDGKGDSGIFKPYYSRNGVLEGFR